jgi:hypothetical protein
VRTCSSSAATSRSVGNPAQQREYSELVRHGRKRAPRRDERELLLHRAALIDERCRPERCVVGGLARALPRRLGSAFVGADLGRDATHVVPHPIEPLSRRRDRRGPRVVGRFEVAQEMRQGRRRPAADDLGQHLRRVTQAFEPAHVDDRSVGDRRKARPQRHEVPGEIAAIDGRDVERRQRLSGAGVVPVVEMPLVTLERRHGAERIRRSLDELPRGDEAEIVGRQVGEERQAHVGGDVR